MLRIIIVSTVILVAAGTSFGQVDWIEHPITTDYNGAWGIYPIDMDGDDDVDLVTTGFEANEITWWENDGAQHFLEHNIDDNLNRAAGVHAGDLDGDGDMDVIGTAYAGHEITWYENDGQMNFTKFLLVQNYSYPPYALMHDVDDDNDMDIVTCSHGDGDISWWENTGYPNFSRHDIDNSFDGCRQLDISDLDDDNDNDILVAGQTIAQIAWYENNGNQVFQKHVVIDSYYAFWAQSYDFDDDNDWDILGCAAENNDISWFENDGSMNFSRHIIDNNVGQPYSVKAADLDLDGDLDVLSANAVSSDVAYWINNGNGSFTKYVACGFSYPVSVYSIDLDFDSDIDIMASAFGNDKVSWLENCYFSIPAFVVGTVTDEWGTPAESVYVYDRDITDSDYTNLYGQYDLELYDGNFDIIFQKDGYYDTTAYNIPATTGDTTILDISLISFQIPCASCVRGIVENREPAIIESVYVWASGTGVEYYTDFLGRYSLVGLAPGFYDIMAYHQLYRDTTIIDIFVTNDSATTLNLTLEGNGAVTGFVGDSISQPISGAIVEIPDLLLYDTTDINGEYFIMGIIPGISHDVWFWHFNHMGYIINDVVVAINETLLLDSVYLLPIEHEVTVWYGNPDLSPIVAPVGDTVYVDLYVQTVSYLNIEFLHLPLGTDDQYIVGHHSYTGGNLYYPLSEWDDVSFLQPDVLSPGWHSQSLLGFMDLGGDPNPYLRCPGPMRIASYALEVANDSSLIGDTVDCFMEGYNPINGGPLFVDSTQINVFIPYQHFSSLYFVGSSSGGCEYVVGDANNSGDFNGMDVTYGVSYFKGGPQPTYECECTEGNTWYVAGDVNGSCGYNGLDITYAVAYFKGGPDPIPCPDCPPVG